MTSNNMFAYCLNNPANASDCTGQRSVYRKDILGACCAGAVFALSFPLLEQLGEAAENTLNSLKNDVYNLSRAVRQELAEKIKQMPNVHHIVPWGSFSNRSPATQKLLIEMQQVLYDAGIDVRTDPINLMLVSSSTHTSLHTDAYILYVHSRIMASDRSQSGIYSALFQLRIEIAAMDQFACGY